jgi:ATP-dependent helicase HrpB
VLWGGRTGGGRGVGGSVEVVTSRGPSLPGPAQPVDAVLPALTAALGEHAGAVLVAPPGAGKTTRVPLALDATPASRVVILEPRRVAARAAAARLAAQLGEPVGRSVGLTTRDERRTSAATRIEVVTDGVVLRRLQRDASLSGVGTLVFDEYHERTLEADLALAFAIETRAVLRPDLRLLVMSATLDVQRVGELLGGAPTVHAEGRQHPVRVEHRDVGAPRDGADLRGLPPVVADAVADVLAEGDGDVLVFLPGVGEISRTRSYLAERQLPGDPHLVPLHGSLPAAEQDAALRAAPDGRRRVVLATDIAETSVTLPGVTVVVDTGWSREPRYDAANAMSGLVTVPASRASAEQRAGRAGRVRPGRCVRLWPEREHARRDAHPRPAVLTDDLTGAALEVAAWGADVTDLALLDHPPTAVWERARTTLAELGALDDTGRISAHGRQLAALPLHPRLGHLVLAGRSAGEGQLAAEVAALLADRDPLLVDRDRPTADLTDRVLWLRDGSLPPGARARSGARGRLRRETDRLVRAARHAATDGQTANTPGAGGRTADGDSPPDAGHADLGGRIGALVARSWPDRVAAARGAQRGSFVLAGGRGAELPDGDPLAASPLLAVAALDRGRTAARIHLAAPIDPVVLAAGLGDLLEVQDEIAWVDGDVVATRRTRLGAVVLQERPLRDPDADTVLGVLLDALQTEGLDLLDRRGDDLQLQARMELLATTLGPPWRRVDDASLLEAADTVLAPFLLRARRRRDLAAIRFRDVLRSQLPGGRLDELDRLAPTHVTVPSGSRIQLDYRADHGPVLAVRVQELFGAVRTPSVVDGRVPLLLHLLSPAGRPVQVTDDLAGFWERAYPEVRAELRGRYPKHAWPEDGATATPLRGTGRRRRAQP